MLYLNLISWTHTFSFSTNIIKSSCLSIFLAFNNLCLSSNITFVKMFTNQTRITLDFRPPISISASRIVCKCVHPVHNYIFVTSNTLSRLLQINNVGLYILNTNSNRFLRECKICQTRLRDPRNVLPRHNSVLRNAVLNVCFILL